jgi:PTH1 family peptidyl-tRNA hydrolase
LLARHDGRPADFIVVCDDVALPWGMIRVRERGSAGSHNGLKSVIGALGTMEFPRVRLGIQPEQDRGELRDYVLRPIRKDEEELVAEVVEQGAEAVKLIVAEGAPRAMNRFNRRVPSSPGDALAE